MMQKTWNCLKPWHMGTHPKVLIHWEPTWQDLNVFFKNLCVLVLWTKVASALEAIGKVVKHYDTVFFEMIPVPIGTQQYQNNYQCFYKAWSLVSFLCCRWYKQFSLSGFCLACVLIDPIVRYFVWYFSESHAGEFEAVRFHLQQQVVHGYIHYTLPQQERFVWREN